MGFNIWSEVPLSPGSLARLQSLGQVNENGTFANLPGCDVAIIGPSTVDAGFIAQCGPSLKIALRSGIGYEKVDVATCSAHGVLTANTPDGPTESTAEQAVMLLLAIARNLYKAGQHLRAGQWNPYTELRGKELRDQLLGVVGFGRIGRRVTEICALGIQMPVLVFDPFVKVDVSRYPGIRVAESLDEVLQQADFVTLHTPLMPETRHMIGERELRLMKPGSYLVNVSRGGVIDEAALIRALEQGHLAGAGLDVFEVEPTPIDNPLLRMSNVVATPHAGGNTLQGTERMMSGVIDQIEQLAAGQRPTFLLDPSAWPGRAKLLLQHTAL